MRFDLGILDSAQQSLPFGLLILAKFAFCEHFSFIYHLLWDLNGEEVTKYTHFGEYQYAPCKAFESNCLFGLIHVTWYFFRCQIQPESHDLWGLPALLCRDSWTLRTTYPHPAWREDNLQERRVHQWGIIQFTWTTTRVVRWVTDVRSFHDKRIGENRCR